MDEDISGNNPKGNSPSPVKPEDGVVSSLPETENVGATIEIPEIPIVKQETIYTTTPLSPPKAPPKIQVADKILVSNVLSKALETSVVPLKQPAPFIPSIPPKKEILLPKPLMVLEGSETDISKVSTEQTKEPVKIGELGNFSPKEPREIAPQAGNKEQPSKVRAIRTYQADVAESVKDNKTSLVRMVIAEHTKKKDTLLEESPRSTKNIIFISLGAILLIGGMVMGVYFFNKTRSASLSESTEKKAPSLFFAEKDRAISITGLSSEVLGKSLGALVAGTEIKLDTMINVYFTEKSDGLESVLTTQRFFFFLDNRMPPSLLRAFDKKFMFGVHTFNGNHPFLVFKTNLYENTFAGLLGWERYMARDLFPIFNIKRQPGDPLFEKPFEDRIIKNRDARVLSDESGTPLLFYVFKDKQTVIFTDSEATLEEVVRRLNTQSGS